MNYSVSEKATELQSLDQTIEVYLKSRGNEAREMEYELHLCSEDDTCCFNRYNESKVITTTVRQFIECEASCDVGLHLLSQELTVEIPGSPEHELSVGVGRSPAEILYDEGYVWEAAEKFGTRFLMVSYLADIPVSKAIDEYTERNNRSRFRNEVFCKSCGAYYRSGIGKYPLVPKFTLDCDSCYAVHEYDMREHIPEYDHLQAYVNAQAKNYSWLRAWDPLIGCNINIEDVTFGEPTTKTEEMHILKTDSVRAHQIHDGEVRCGSRPSHGIRLGVIDSEITTCSNCLTTNNGR